MKKSHRNWYFLTLFFLIIGFIILFSYLGKPNWHYIGTTSILGAFGVHALLSAILTKTGYISNAWIYICKDIASQRNSLFFMELIEAIVLVLGAAINWYTKYDTFGATIFIALSIYCALFYYFRWLYKNK